MRAALRCLPLLLLPLAIACGGGESSPTAPSATPPATTRIIAITGSLAFGEVAVGNQRDLSITISNSGNATLTVTGMSVTGGLSAHTTASWTSGPIAPGASQSVTIRFAPTSAGSFSGTLTVNADQTSGTNTIAISGTAQASFSGTWSGRYVVERCDGTGSVQDVFCSQNRGLYPVGTSLPISLTLTQNGGSVSGTVALGQVIGVVNGVVTPDGQMTLQGTATSGTVSITFTSWSSRAAGNGMEGTFTYNVGATGVGGVAAVATRLSGVTRR
ncbi:MAG: choice-of-anchor D domain-containing protein [Acidobacteria bacterium]|nr:choice-of-anchor D domain-containing protein [Acidobacteriota bacterium]